MVLTRGDEPEQDADATGDAAHSARGPRPWRRLPLAWRRATLAALGLRLATAIGALVTGGLLPGLDPVGVAPSRGFAGWAATPAGEQGWGLLGAGLERFDALWYLAIAASGYPTTTEIPQAAAFFPVLPLLVATVAVLVGGSHLLAGNLVVLVATVTALAGIHRLIEGETGEVEVARRGVVALAVFPSAFFLVAPYSESLFLAVSVWGLVWLRQRAWGPATVVLAVAGATRNVGILLVVPAVVEALRGHGDGRLPGRLAVVAAAPAGLGAYLAFGHARWGTWLAPVQVQTGWQRELTWPWTTLVDAARTGFGAPGVYASGYHALDAVVFLPVALAVLWLLVRGPLSLSLYSLAHVAVWLAYPFGGRPLMSTPRFALAVAPLFLVFAAWLAGRTRETVWVAVSGALLGVHLALYVGWYYVF